MSKTIFIFLLLVGLGCQRCASPKPVRTLSVETFFPGGLPAARRGCELMSDPDRCARAAVSAAIVAGLCATAGMDAGEQCSGMVRVVNGTVRFETSDEVIEVPDVGALTE